MSKVTGGFQNSGFCRPSTLTQDKIHGLCSGGLYSGSITGPFVGNNSESVSSGLFGTSQKVSLENQGTVSDPPLSKVTATKVSSD